jgi:FtsP/CotA-like multicopper oxidase with cupredoxin domain
MRHCDATECDSILRVNATIATFCLAVATALAATAGVPEVQSNDNRRSAGHLASGVLTCRLEVREGVWNPEGKDGPQLPIEAFAEEGHQPSNPGPLIRVVAGTRVRVVIRNLLAATLTVHGLGAHKGADAPSFIVAPQQAHEVEFQPARPGVYLYWASTAGSELEKRTAIESQLSGALVIDAPGTDSRADRIFVLGHWNEPGDPKATPPRPDRQAHVINGKSWPHTERLTYPVGQSIQWRWINGTDEAHPLHLHGHYFMVDAKGDEKSWAALSRANHRRAVTQTIQPGTSMDLSWLPERSGNWLFHCHILFHIAPELRLTPDAIDAHHEEHDASRHMAGLVLGITITQPKPAPVPTRAQPHRLRLVVGERAGVDLHGDPGLGYQLAETEAEPRDGLGKFTAPGPPIVLKRGQPVEIAVENRLKQPTSVHWHGIELESYYDGVPGWGGDGQQITPPIRPGETFVAKFTPPRAGTFMYHTHFNDYIQLSTGLYGPMIVTAPDQQFDPEFDKVFVLSRGGTDDEKDPFLINGSTSPPPVELLAGKRYRLRFIGITPGPPLEITLERNGQPEAWRPVAKDGADLIGRGRMEAAKLTLFPGETYDFEFQPAATGEFRLKAVNSFFKLQTIAPFQLRKLR